MKKCTRCGSEKTVAEFNRNRTSKDGLQTRCKSCQIEANREWSHRNPEARRAASRVQYQRELVRFGARRKSKQSDPVKHRAHVAVENAVKDCRLFRPAVCESCGASGRAIQAHHHDYAKPLDVQWLCAPCHGLLHAHDRRTA